MLKKGILGLLFCVASLQAQEVDPSLVRLKERLDSISSFKADIRMEVDISFVNMPPKHAQISYSRGEPIAIASEDFVMLPKRGLDLTFSELFRHPFMTLNIGAVRVGERKCELIKIIPTSDRSKFAIATLWLDPSTLQVLKSRVSTKKHGEYDVAYQYDGPRALLPNEIRVEMEVSGMKIPLRFLGKDTRIDRDQMKQEGPQKGTIYLQMYNYEMSRL